MEGAQSSAPQGTRSSAAGSASRWAPSSRNGPAKSRRGSWKARVLVLTFVVICLDPWVIKDRAAVTSREPVVADQPKEPAKEGGFTAAFESRLQSMQGPVGIAFFLTCQVTAIIVCVPCSSTFDYTAGAVFGFFGGVLMASVGKVVAAILTFALVRTLSSGWIGCWVQERARGEGTPWLNTAQKINQGIKQGGFTTCIVLRLSPLPSWVANYMLPLAGVPFATYVPASLVGMLPPILCNVFSGYAGKSVVGAVMGGDGGHVLRKTLLLSVIAAVQWLMGVVLVKRMAQYANNPGRGGPNYRYGTATPGGATPAGRLTPGRATPAQ